MPNSMPSAQAGDGKEEQHNRGLIKSVSCCEEALKLLSARLSKS